MIEVPVDLFYGKVSFVAELTNHPFGIFLFHKTAAITIVGFFFRDLLKAVASQMKTRVTEITIEHLVGVIVETAKTYFAVSFKKLFGSSCVFAFDRFQHLFSLNQLIELFFSFILISVFEILEYSGPE